MLYVLYQHDGNIVEIFKGKHDTCVGRVTLSPWFFAAPLIFQELGDHPGKALKYPPEDAQVFAEKYIAGQYTYIDMNRIKWFREKTDASRAHKPSAPAAAATEEEPGQPERPEEPMGEDEAGDVRGVTSETLSIQKIFLRPGSIGFESFDDYVAESRKAKEKGQAAVEVAGEGALGRLVALYDKHRGDMQALFDELKESPRKALKYPPKDAQDFAERYMAGALSDYATSGAAATSEANQPPNFLDEQDLGMNPVDALKLVFPFVDQEVLMAIFEAADGQLETAVEMVLSAQHAASQAEGWGNEPTHLEPLPSPPPPLPPTAETRGAGEESVAPDAPPPLGAMEARLELSDMQTQELGRVIADATNKHGHVLSILVPDGAQPGTILKIGTNTSLGELTTQVPSGTFAGQSLFIKVKSGNPFAKASGSDKE